MGNNLDIKHIVYITTNKVNGKVYIGVHQTNKPYEFDGYLGNSAWINNPSSYNKGKYPIHAAILKYGTHNFVRRTLKVFDNRQDALDLEAWLVNDEFIKRPDTYNIVVGGGAPPILNKEVYQFDIKGNFIKKWISETEINKFYETHVQFSDIINNKRSFAGYFWSFTPSINIEEYKTENKYGFISQYNLDGVLLATYKSTTIAAQKLDLNRDAITRSVLKKTPYAGCYFLKADVDIAEVMSNKYKPMLGKNLVYRYLKTGELDAKFTSILQAEKSTPNVGKNSIAKSIINRKLNGGYYWAYVEADNYFNIADPGYKKLIKIAQYTKEGELIKVWSDPKECKSNFPYCMQVCQGKAKSTQGYVFKYIQD